MPYTSNPKMPRLRAKAVNMVRSGHSIRSVAKYFGYEPSTVSRWCKKVKVPLGVRQIPTLSSRPHSHPDSVSGKIIDHIVFLRKLTGGRCAEVIHQMMINAGISVSLSSVKRTLDRQGLTRKKSKWKRYHRSTERPTASRPGDLVQVDTIHLMENESRRIYIYTLLDVYSRWAYAEVSEKINTVLSVSFVRAAQRKSPFVFHHLQSDHGSEFSKQFTERIQIKHRHSRVRRPNDNAHLERFNRTLQSELLRKLPISVATIQSALPGYLKHYNEERLHLGIRLKTPSQLISGCCEAID